MFAPASSREEIAEIAAKLRKAAGLPKEPTGVVANNGSTNGKSSSTKAKKKAKAG